MSEYYNCVYTETTAMAVESYSQIIGDGVNVQYTIPHNFNTYDVGAIVRDIESNLLIYPAIKIDSLSSVLLSFSSPPSLNAYSVTLLAGLSTRRIDGFRDRVVVNVTPADQESIFVSITGTGESLSATLITPSGLWGTITGNIQDQIDLWNILTQKLNTGDFIPTLTSALLVTPTKHNSIDVQNFILSAGVNLFDIFVTSETDNQILNYSPSNYLLSISNGNTISLSSINTAFTNNSANYNNAYSWVNTNSAFATFNSLTSLSVFANSISGTFYGDGSNLTNVIIPGQININNVVENLSSIWTDTYNTVTNLSSEWTDTYNTVNSLSSNWTDTYNTVTNISSTWVDTYNTVTNLSTSWIDTYNTVTNISSTLVDASNTVNSLSSNWVDTYNTVTNLSSNWVDTYNTVTDLSSNWTDTYSTVTNLSSNWVDTYNTVTDLSSTLVNTSNTVNSLSSNWNSSYNLSNTLATLSSQYLPLSGGTMFGTLSSISNLAIQTDNILPALFVRQLSVAPVAQFFNFNNRGFEVNNNEINFTCNTNNISGNIIGNNLRVSFNEGVANGNYSFAENLGTAIGVYSHAEGYITFSIGEFSHAEGNNTIATGFTSHSEGADTQSLGYASHAEGSYTIAFGLGSHSEGQDVLVTGIGSHGEGSDVVASGNASHAEGSETATGEQILFNNYDASTKVFTFIPQLSSKFSYVTPGYIIKGFYWPTTTIRILFNIIVADRNTSNGSISAVNDPIGENITFGGLYTNSGRSGHAEGKETIVEGEGGHAEGIQTVAGIGAHAEGFQTTAVRNSHAEGSQSYVVVPGSHVEGQQNIVANAGSHAEGTNTVCGDKVVYVSYNSTTNKLLIFNDPDRNNAIISSILNGMEYVAGFGLFGANVPTYFIGKILEYNTSTNEMLLTNMSTGLNSTGGWIVITSGFGTHAEGTSTIAVGEGSHAEGFSTIATGVGSHSEGIQTESGGEASHAEGVNTYSEGTASHTEGTGTYSSGESSHAEGNNTIASGEASHAEGVGTSVYGEAGHTEGFECISYGLGSHAEGILTYVELSGSHAEGIRTGAYGDGSHAEGFSTKAFGSYSHAEGQFTEANGIGSHAAGYYVNALHDNTWIWKGSTNTNYLSSSRSNQFMISAEGGLALLGNVGINTDSIENALTVVGTISTDDHQSSKEWSEAYNISTFFAETSASIARGEYLPLSGGTVTGNVTIENTISLSSITFTGNTTTSTIGITATDIFVEILINGTPKYIRLFDTI